VGEDPFEAQQLCGLTPYTNPQIWVTDNCPVATRDRHDASQQWPTIIRSGNVIAIPESGSATHVKENVVALSLNLTPQELQTLDAAHPPPGTRFRR
jgi:hypothetical protein